ncbi:MAG: sugar nucleotide-binding protein, partial [Puia sp.]
MAGNKSYSLAVAGMNGQLGKELTLLVPHFPQFRVQFLSREDFPLNDAEIMETWLKENPVDCLINGAAYTAVDKAESETAMAYRINGEAPGILARLLAQQGGKLIQLSTDYVFDGQSDKALDESA